VAITETHITSQYRQHRRRRIDCIPEEKYDIQGHHLSSLLTLGIVCSNIYDRIVHCRVDCIYGVDKTVAIIAYNRHGSEIYIWICQFSNALSTRFNKRHRISLQHNSQFVPILVSLSRHVPTLVADINLSSQVWE
jgi:hypothetical protein